MFPLWMRETLSFAGPTIEMNRKLTRVHAGQSAGAIARFDGRFVLFLITSPIAM